MTYTSPSTPYSGNRSALGDTVRDGREIEADILGSRLPRIFAIDAGIYALVIADMVLKPLS